MRTILERNTSTHHNSRGALASLLQHERNPEFPDTTWVEPQIPCCNLRGTPPAEFPAANQEQPQDFLHNSRDTLHSQPQLEWSPKSSVSTQEEPRVPRCTSRGTPNSLPQLKRRPNCPAATREELPGPPSTRPGPPALPGHGG